MMHENTFSYRFAAWLREINKEYTYSQLGDFAGVAPATILRWANRVDGDAQKDSQMDAITRLLARPELKLSSEELFSILGWRQTKFKANQKGSVSFLELSDGVLIEFAAEKRERIKAGIEAFKNFYGGTWRVGSVSSLVQVYKDYIGAIQSGALRIVHVDRDTELEDELTALADRGAFPGLSPTLPEDGANRNEPNPLKVIRVAKIERIDGTPIHAEFVAWLAARTIFGDYVDKAGNIQNYSSNADVIAIGRAYTVWRVAHHSVLGSLKNTTWVPLNAFVDDWAYRYSANNIVADLMRLHPGTRGKYLSYVPRGSRAGDNGDVRSIRTSLDDKINGVMAILTVDGLGERYRGQDPKDWVSRGSEDDYVTPTPIKQVYRVLERKSKTIEGYYDEVVSNFGGEVCGVFLGKDAELFHDTDVTDVARDVSSQLYKWADFKQSVLKSIMLRGIVWVVASGRHKLDATYMAMKHGLANAFVIDREIARGIIDKVKTEKESHGAD